MQGSDSGPTGSPQTLPPVFRELLLRVSGLSGEACLQRMVQELAGTFGAAFSFVGATLPSRPSRVRTLAGWGPEGPIPPLEYDLAGSPCEQVLGRSACFFPEAVQARFPADRDLVALGIEAYLGQPIYGSDGSLIGLVNILSRQPLSPSADALLILDLFAARAGVEVERVRAEDLRRESQDLLGRLERMNAVVRMGAGLAQELNRELGIVQDFASLMGSDLEEGVLPDRTDLETLQAAAHRASALVAGLEAFGRPAFNPAQVYDAGQRLHRIVALLRPVLPPKVELLAEVQAMELELHGDPSHLDLIIGNLVLQARDALPSGGRIFLRGQRAADGVVLEVLESSPSPGTLEGSPDEGLAGIRALAGQMGARLEGPEGAYGDRCFRILLSA